MQRTTHDKTYNDFIRCTMLPKQTLICFLDNCFFNKMVNSRIYYIKPRSYYHHLSVDEIIDRFLASDIGLRFCKMIGNDMEVLENKEDIRLFIRMSFRNSPNLVMRKYSPHDAFTNMIVAQKIMYHLKEFFYLTQRKRNTKKITTSFGRFTHKRRVA